MFRLSKLTDYAVVMLAEMARHPAGTLLSASSLAERTGLPEPTVAKILKLLTKQGLIASVRGVSGGYRLDKAPDALPVTKIIEAMEGPIALTACVEGSHDSCALEGVCALNGRWSHVNKAIQTALTGVTLADMT